MIIIIITQITILARYLYNTTFFLTNIHDYLYFFIPLFIKLFSSLSRHSFYPSKTAVRAVEIIIIIIIIIIINIIIIIIIIINVIIGFTI